MRLFGFSTLQPHYSELFYSVGRLTGDFYSFTVLLIYTAYKSGTIIRKIGAIYKDTVLSALNTDNALLKE